MIQPDSFYDAAEKPSAEEREEMWNRIQRAVRRGHGDRMLVVDRRSFFYGIAATFVLMFASVGLYTAVANFISSSRPTPIRLDSAYESAIQQFERFVPAVGSLQPGDRSILSTRKEQLRSLDAAITDLKKDVNGNDLSPLKRGRLRQLYSMKLHLIQEMIEQGEIDL